MPCRKVRKFLMQREAVEVVSSRPSEDEQNQRALMIQELANAEPVPVVVITTDDMKSATDEASGLPPQALTQQGERPPLFSPAIPRNAMTREKRGRT